jgi:diguanylate cyclase (GGDEF)-like protein/PAS domain S-box-containing protein
LSAGANAAPSDCPLVGRYPAATTAGPLALTKPTFDEFTGRDKRTQTDRFAIDLLQVRRNFATRADPERRTLGASGGEGREPDMDLQGNRLFRDDAFYRKVVESSNVAMVVVGTDAVVRHHTRAAALLLAGSDLDLVGRLFPSLFAPDSQEGVDAFLQRVAEAPSEITPVEAWCHLDDGEVRWVEMTAVNLVESPEVAGVVVSLVDRTELRRALDLAEKKADFDPLTGLFNRRSFEECARGIFRDGSTSPAFVAMFDIDHLKSHNDTWGHQVGDDMLRLVGSRISTAVGTAGTVARLGGDEFAVMLPGLSRAAARRLLDSACRAIQAPIEGTDVRVSATCGVALSTMARHWPGLLHRADAALYEGKKIKRGSVCFFRGDEPGWERRRQTDRDALLAAEKVVADLKSDVLRLEEETRRDRLTGLLNAAAFEEDRLPMHAAATKEGATYAIVLCDIDFFHNYNQRYLYQPANVTLRRVADAINGACRPGDLVYRYGGEEMVVALRNTAVAEACEVGERVRAAVAALALPHDSRTDSHVVVTISVGVAAADCKAGSTSAGVVDAANRALIVAKGAGRNRVECAA